MRKLNIFIFSVSNHIYESKPEMAKGTFRLNLTTQQLINHSSLSGDQDILESAGGPSSKPHASSHYLSNVHISGDNVPLISFAFKICIICSIGDWFVLYQMSKNLNKRFFAEFLALLSVKVGLVVLK
jgi:sensor histidine kinase YesM